MLRSINQAHKIILQQDPDTAVTAHALRCWIKEGKIRHLKSGTRVLVEVESLMNYVNGTK